MDDRNARAPRQWDSLADAVDGGSVPSVAGPQT